MFLGSFFSFARQYAPLAAADGRRARGRHGRYRLYDIDRLLNRTLV
jgi:hypothetical protein